METRATHSLHSAQVAAVVQLREICGKDELSSHTADSLALELTSNREDLPADISLSTIDHILARIYRSIYGDRIECFARCVHCNRNFEMSFALSDWLESLNGSPIDTLRPLGSETYELQDEHGRVVFRLPTITDLRSLATERSDLEQALLERCVLEGNREHSGLDSAMAQAGPLLDGEIESMCAYCELSQMVDFCLSDYLLDLLHRERSLVVREVHYIARAYRWSREEILAMPRTSRQEHVRLVLAESRQEEVFH